MIKARNLLLAILSIFLVSPSAVMLANNFDAVEQYMREKYVRGLHNSTFMPATHEIFVQDFEMNQLFVGFKKALQVGDREARNVFESLLRDLKNCLTLEKALNVRSLKQLRIVCGSMVAIGCTFMLLGKSHACMAAFVGTGFGIREHSAMVRRQRVVEEDLEKRIELWSQMLPGASSDSTVTIEKSKQT